MNLFQMKCPNCGADLNVEDGLESFFCQYCGTRIVLEGQSDAALKAKSRIKTMDKLGDMQKEYHEYRRVREIQKEKERKRNAKNAKIVAIVCGILLIVMGIAIYFGAILPEQKAAERLETIYAEIQQDIADGNYDSALVKANSLHWDGSGLDTKRKWDKTREGIIEIIEDLRTKN